MTGFDDQVAAAIEPEVSLRDHMAMHAMVALYACIPFVTALDKTSKKEGVEFKTALAQHAYLMADAMLAERDR